MQKTITRHVLAPVIASGTWAVCPSVHHVFAVDKHLLGASMLYRVTSVKTGKKSNQQPSSLPIFICPCPKDITSPITTLC